MKNWKRNWKKKGRGSLKPIWIGIGLFLCITLLAVSGCSGLIMKGLIDRSQLSLLRDGILVLASFTGCLAAVRLSSRKKLLNGILVTAAFLMILLLGRYLLPGRGGELPKSLLCCLGAAVPACLAGSLQGRPKY